MEKQTNNNPDQTADTLKEVEANNNFSIINQVALNQAIKDSSDNSEFHYQNVNSNDCHVYPEYVRIRG